jgi:hypothetical protein
MLKIILIAFAVLLLAAAIFVVVMIGPRNIIGMLRYDQRKEGPLKVGDAAPDIALVALDGATPVHLRESVGGKPLIIIFGSYT